MVQFLEVTIVIQRARITHKMRMHELFASTDPAVLESVLDDKAETGTFQRGDIIADDRSSSGTLAFILTGNAIKRRIDNDLCAVRIGEGSIFGLEAMFSTGSNAANVLIATRDTSVLFLTKAGVLQLLHDDPNFAMRVIRLLSDLVITLEQRVTTYTGGNAQNRLARYLNNAFSENMTFELDCSMQQIATMLDISRPSLYRAFSCLQEDGVIRREGKIIYLISRELLMQCISKDQIQKGEVL